ncbi:hypothetical protein [Streptomyces jumonjinensis]|uniref:hypothetical protein n=1 Tax=Streptomyces jumonjinensis TaxID=1945 RepID=UPI00378CDF26
MLRFWDGDLLAAGPLEEAFGDRAREDGPITRSIVAHWDRLGFYTGGEHERWTAAQWAEFLDDPTHEWPFAADERGAREPIFRLTIDLYRSQREPRRAEWAQIVQRLARAAGLAQTGGAACRWVAVRSRPCSVDLLANLIRLDGAWQPHPVHRHQHVGDEVCRIVADLGLIRTTRPARDASQAVPVPATPDPYRRR